MISLGFIHSKYDLVMYDAGQWVSASLLIVRIYNSLDIPLDLNTVVVF